MKQQKAEDKNEIHVNINRFLELYANFYWFPFFSAFDNKTKKKCDS